MNVCKKGCAVLLALSLTFGTVSGYQPATEVMASNKTAQEKGTKKAERKVTKEKDATIYDLGNGKKKAEFYAGDVRFADENGELKDYDTSLVRAEDVTGDYVYETAESDKMSYFPEKLSEDTPVLSEYDRYEISIHSDTDKKGTRKSRKGKTDTEQVMDLYDNQEEKKTSIEYDGIWEDASLEYESTNDGLKENIILEDATAPSRYHFVLSMKNCCVVTQKQFLKDKVEVKKKIETEEGESLYLYDMAEKKLVGSIPAGYMMDAAGEYSEGCTYVLQLKEEKEAGEEVSYMYEMCLKADETYLEASERKYPVTIDPSVVWTSKAAQTSSAYVCRTSPNSTYTDENGPILCVGKRDAAKDVCRGYINFSGINVALTDKYVEKATLTLNTIQANTGMSVYVRNVCSSWNSSTITYNSQPKRTEGVLGSFKTTKSAEKVQVSLDANVLYNYTRNEESLYGVELTDSKTDTNTSSSKTVWVYNSNSVNNARMPKLEVEYWTVDRTTTPQLKYQVYRNAAGWSPWEEDGETAGDLKETRKLRALKMDFESNGFTVATVKYRAYFETSGWTEWMPEGDTAGDINSDENMKAVEMKVYNCRGVTELYEAPYYEVYYRVYVKGRGWIGWAKNGATAGDYTSGACIEGIQAVVVPVVRNKRWYVLDGETDASIYLDRDFDLAIGEGSKICGIATAFYDQKLAEKNQLEIVAYAENGESFSGKTEKKFVVRGNEDGENYLIGCTVEADNVDLAAKYDVEHMVSVSDSEFLEEDWKKNEMVSGDKNQGIPIELFGARLVPKDYEESERACYSNRFIVSEDGYSFKNWHPDFRYGKNYKISVDKYVALYGDDKGQELFKESEDWGGSCFGMCVSALLFYNGYWNPEDFSSGVDKGAQSAGRLYKQTKRKSRRLTDLIEYCQIMWGFHGQGEDYISTYENYPKIINLLKKMSEENPYIMIMLSKDGAHAVIPLEIQHIGDGVYEIHLYDVNEPNMISKAIIDNDKFIYGDFYNARLLNIHQWMEGKDEIYTKVRKLILETK